MSFIFRQFLVSVILLLYDLLVTGSLADKVIPVNFPPHFTKLPPLVVYVRPEEHLVLPCHAASSPPPSYQWLLNGQTADWVKLYHPRTHEQGVIRYLKHDTRNEGKQTLFWYFGHPGEGTTFRPGTYQCMAWNQYGRIISDPVKVKLAKLGRFQNLNEQNVILRPGETVKLNCSVTPSVPKGIIRWMFRSEDGMLHFLKESQTAATDDEGNLYLTNLLPTTLDNRTLMCSLSNPILRTISTGPNVHIQFVQSVHKYQPAKRRPRIVFSSNTRQVVIVNHSLTLNCILVGNPLPVIVWQWSRHLSSLPIKEESNLSPVNEYFTDVDKISKSNNVIVRHGGTELYIPTIQPVHQGTYRCSVKDLRNPPQRPTPFITYEVHVEGPPKFAIIPKNTIVPLFGSTILHCASDSELTIPSANVTWSVNTKPIDTYLDGDSRKIINQSLYLNNLTVADVAAFQCKLTNRHGWRIVNAYVNVWNRAPAIIRSLKSETIVAETQSITLHCETLGAPKSNVQWRNNAQLLHDGMSITEQKTTARFQLRESGNLFIKNVTTQDSGMYTCIASNIFGSSKAIGRLVVRKPTRILSGPQLINRSGEKSTQRLNSGKIASPTRITEQSFLQLKCEATTDPLELKHLKISWMRDNAPLEWELKHTESRITMSLDGSILTISKTVPSDSGLYTCTAQSQLDHDNATVQVIVEGRPGPPTQVTVRCVNSKDDNRFAVISWIPGPANDAPILETHIEMVTGAYRPFVYSSLSHKYTNLNLTTKDGNWWLNSSNETLEAANKLAIKQLYFNRWSRAEVVTNVTLIRHLNRMFQSENLRDEFAPQFSTAFVQLYADVVYYFRIRLENHVGLSEASEVVPRLDNVGQQLCYTPPEPVRSLPKELFVYGTKPNNLVIKWKPLSPIKHNGPGLVYRITITCLDCKLGPLKPITNTTVVSNWSVGVLVLENLTTSEQIRTQYIHDVRVWPIETYRTYEITLLPENLLGSSILEPLVQKGRSGEGIPQLQLEPPEVQHVGSEDAVLRWKAIPKLELNQKIWGYFRGFRIEWCEADLTNELCEYYRVYQDYIVRQPPRWSFAELRTASQNESSIKKFDPVVQLSNNLHEVQKPISKDNSKQKPNYGDLMLSNNTYTARLGNLPGRTRLKITISILNIQYSGPPSQPIYILTKEGVPDAVPEFAATFVGVNHVELSWVQPMRINGILTAYDIEVYQVLGNRTITHNEPQLSVSGSQDKQIKQLTIQDPTQLATRISELKMDTEYIVHLWPRTRTGRGLPRSIRFRTARLLKDGDEPCFQINYVSSSTHSINVSLKKHLLWTVLDSLDELELRDSSKHEDLQDHKTYLTETTVNSNYPPSNQWLHDQDGITPKQVDSRTVELRNADSFYTQFRRVGQKFWEETQREFRKPWIVLHNLLKDEKYEIRVVLVKTARQPMVSRSKFIHIRDYIGSRASGTLNKATPSSFSTHQHSTFLIGTICTGILLTSSVISSIFILHCCRRAARRPNISPQPNSNVKNRKIVEKYNSTRTDEMLPSETPFYPLDRMTDSTNPSMNFFRDHSNVFTPRTALSPPIVFTSTLKLNAESVTYHDFTPHSFDCTDSQRDEGYSTFTKV